MSMISNTKAAEAEVRVTAEAGRSRWLLVPPPLLFVVSFVVGVQLHRLVPVALVPASIEAAARPVGVALVALAALLPASAVALFLRRWTTIIPHARARSLVTAGPYRITRNPMYLGLTAAYVGVALTVNVIWPLLFLALPVWVLSTRVIPFEEANLVRIFGAEYLAYQRRVRRWI